MAAFLVSSPGKADPGDGNAKAAPADSVHELSGISLVGPVDREPPAVSETLALAHSKAVVLAQNNPTDFGYPWVDPTRQELHVSAATSRGRELAALLNLGLATSSASRVNDLVDVSWQRLEGIKDDAIGLRALGVAGADAIFMTEPDYQHNRVIITVSALRDDLMVELAGRYGTKAIAVRLDPRRPQLTDQGRNNDIPAFYGGSLIDTPETVCTSGFPWYSGTTSMMVTAAHCTYDGGNVSTYYPWFMGTVTASSRENDNPGVGTVYLTGQTVYRGDIALIEMPSGTTSGTRIFRGGYGSSTSADIDSMWNRSPAIGDKYCTGGAIAGEICGWTVTQVRVTYTMANGKTRRNMTLGTKSGACSQSGDSGGPVYTVLTNGNVVAKGIHSGGSSSGGTCSESFTDIREAYFGFPGQVREI